MKARKSNRTEPRVPLSAEKPEAVSRNNGHDAPGAEGGNGGTALAEPPVTEVVARGDVGFGNSLFIRGEGDGLSWDRGTPLACTDASTWVWSASQAREKVVFKLLLNDQVWAKGEDVVVKAGQRVEVVPGF
jgi:hypothetical protein